MRPRSSYQGFTRKEILVTFAVILVLGTCLASYLYSLRPTKQKEMSAVVGARSIHTMLTTWAQDHDQKFPTARQFSNEAFHELFKARLLYEGGEKLFSIEGDAWHKNSASGAGPDNIIGPAPDFPQALQRGECAYFYVTGLDTASASYLPLLGNGFTESPGVYSNNKSHKGGVFRGEKAAYITVGGSAKAVDLSSDLRILGNKDDKSIDIFSKAWGTNPDDIKNPEG